MTETATQSSGATSLAGCLSGVRVVALEQAIALPYCTFLLAEMGADVIKFERPGTGDVVRGWDDAVRGLSTGYVWVNANKRDIAIDLSQEEGRGVARRIAATADVFVENFTPGVANRLGLGYEDLSNENAGLVYCSLSGYGQTGPSRDTKAYDLLIQGESGILLTNGTPEAPAKVGIPVTDLIGGSTAAMGILAALLERSSTHQGKYLDVSMFDSTLLWLGYYPHHSWHQDDEPPRSGMRHQYLVPYGPYEAKDGAWVNLVVANASDWERFCSIVVKRPEWQTDPRYATVADRRTHREDLERDVERAIAGERSEVWFSRLDEASLPHGRVRTIKDVLTHPQVAARHLVVEADSPVGPLPLIRSPFGDPDLPRRIPGLGEQRFNILHDVGFTEREIATLVEGSVI